MIFENMRTSLYLLMLLAVQAMLTSCTTGEPIELFNGKDLDNWVVYAGSDVQDTRDLFTVRDGVIRCAGKPNGYIRTKETYGNFRLHVEWRWVDEPTNSGVLLHVSGEDKVWPSAIECQLQHGNAGDIVLIGQGTGITVGDSAYRVNNPASNFLVIGKEGESLEKEPGQWNSYDITSQDGTLEVVVNGTPVNSGREMTHQRGHILLQSEGSAIEFRNIRLSELP